MSGFEERVDEATVGSFDPDWHGGRVSATGQPAHQAGQAGSRVFHSERGNPPAVGVLDTDRAHLRGAVDPDEELSSDNVERQHFSQLGGDVTNRG